MLAPDAARGALRHSVLDALLRAESAEAADLAPLRLAPAPVAAAPLQLAAAQTDDPATRCRLVDAYERCLRSYREIARSHAPETTDDDLGAAMAFFVAANLRVLHGIDPDRDLMSRLERGLRGVSRRTSNWAACSAAQRQAFFERIAILGVLVLGSLQSAAAQGPAARSQVRAASHRYLRELLGVDPDMLTLGPEGLTVRRTRPGPAACSAARAA
jgi:hypothetical protein